ncbi:MAG: hypothetical protein K9M75_02350 [Phycisphaerae bacterium]|nr:hypothetical protein [Phycisphaerae bacterium]
MNKNKRIKTVLSLAVMAIATLAAVPANAATMSASDTAPAVNNLDIANLGAQVALDKWWADTKASGYPKGQTFTTGSDNSLLNAITYQISDTQKAEPTKGYVIRVGTIDRVVPGDSSTWVFTEIYSETATQDFTWNSSEYMTWTFDEPVLLSPGTEYGIDVGMTTSTSAWQTGIPYIVVTNDEYAGGTRYMSGTAGNGVGDTTMNNVSRDMKFHLDISVDDPLAPTVDIGDNWITWSGKAVTLDPNNITNNDPLEPQLTYLWTAEPANGVVFSDETAETTDVTITKNTNNPSIVTIALAVTRPGSVAITDTITIDVYDDACTAGIAAGVAVFDKTDMDGNCITDLADFAVLADDWLEDYAITAPVDKPGA